jgi:hypothetical protein
VSYTRLQIDAGLRFDSSTAGGGRPSVRAGIRFNMDASGKTVLEAGYGSVVGSLPLAVEAFDDYPTRVDARINSGTGGPTVATLRPRIGWLRGYMNLKWKQPQPTGIGPARGCHKLSGYPVLRHVPFRRTSFVLRGGRCQRTLDVEGHAEQ